MAGMGNIDKSCCHLNCEHENKKVAKGTTLIHYAICICPNKITEFVHQSVLILCLKLIPMFAHVDEMDGERCVSLIILGVGPSSSLALPLEIHCCPEMPSRQEGTTRLENKK